MNENQLTIVKEYNFGKPIIHKIDSSIDNSFRDCFDKYFHTFKYTCIYDIEFKHIAKKK